MLKLLLGLELSNMELQPDQVKEFKPGTSSVVYNPSIDGIKGRRVLDTLLAIQEGWNFKSITGYEIAVRNLQCLHNPTIDDIKDRRVLTHF